MADSEHLQAYHNKWHGNVNEKNSITQSITKVQVKPVERRINQNPERSMVPLGPVPIPYASAHVELKGQLPQGHGPHIDISQYFTVAPGPGPDRKMCTVS